MNLLLNHPKLLFNELVQVLPEKSSKPLWFFSSLFCTSFLSTFCDVFPEDTQVVLSLGFGSLTLPVYVVYWPWKALLDRVCQQ